MINTIRNTVLSIISKDNRGYITPEEFNLFARQAQLEIFQQYFYDLGRDLIKQNARIITSEYSDHPARMEDVINTFTVNNEVLGYSALSGKFYLQGVIGSPTLFKVNRIVYNLNTEIEQVSQYKIMNLNSSLLTAPSLKYPAYVVDQNGYSIYPTTITSNVTMNFIRTPRDPKWTYNMVGNVPLFNPAQPDYQDFELPVSEGPLLVVKILQYSGISIREDAVVQAMENEEAIDIQKKA
jgi:hypothetical protein